MDTLEVYKLTNVSNWFWAGLVTFVIVIVFVGSIMSKPYDD